MGEFWWCIKCENLFPVQRKLRDKSIQYYLHPEDQVKKLFKFEKKNNLSEKYIVIG